MCRHRPFTGSTFDKPRLRGFFTSPASLTCGNVSLADSLATGRPP